MPACRPPSPPARTHTCAVRNDGTVRCWGNNGSGQLGDTSFTDRPTPVAVGGLTTAVAVSAGSTCHTCALLADGTVRCWGDNDYGQLGDGTTTNGATPVPVAGIRPAAAIAPAATTPAPSSPTAPSAAGATTPTASSATARRWTARTPVR